MKSARRTEVSRSAGPGICPEVRGTWVYPVAKRALLAYAFEQLGMLRMHLRLPDGFQRDTVVYSILAPEWPAVRARLDERLSGRSGAPLE